MLRFKGACSTNNSILILFRKHGIPWSIYSAIFANVSVYQQRILIYKLLRNLAV